MPRKSFLGRFLDNVKRIFDVGETPEPPVEEPPREPPSFPPPPPPPPPPRFSDEERIWRDVTIGQDKRNPYLLDEWLELYTDPIEHLELDRSEFLGFWDKFLRSFYLTTSERGHIRRAEYYAGLGVRQRNYEIDWEEWRRLKRGTP